MGKHKYINNIIRGFVKRFSRFYVSIFKMDVHPDFISMFLLKEGKELLGKNNKNWWLLFWILTATFITIGFANGSLRYLGKKMNDPFVKYVDIEISKGKSDIIGKIEYDLNHDSILKKEYYYSELLGYNSVYLTFTAENKTGKKGTYVFTGRTLSVKDPLLYEIFNNRNKIKGKPFRNKMDFGLIVTKDLLEKLNINLNTPYLPFSFTYFDVNGKHKDTTCPLPVVAIVNELPGMYKFATTPYFQTQKNLSESNPFNPKYTNDIILFSKTNDSIQTDKIEKILLNIINSSDFIKNYDPEIDILSNNNTFIKGKDFRISFMPKAPPSIRKKLVKKIFSDKNLKKYNLIQIFDYNPSAIKLYTKYDLVSVHFNSLDKIKDFKNYILKKYGLEIDMARIDALENYNFITKITRIISLFLISFSILSICLFVGNLLSRHLEKIHVNIGTFKAFGLDNNTLNKIYLLLIYMFIFSALFVSFFTSWLFGLIDGTKILLSLLFNDLEKNESYYHIFEMWTYIAIILMIAISFFVLNNSAKKILKKTPGDLIYSRL